MKILDLFLKQCFPKIIVVKTNQRAPLYLAMVELPHPSHQDFKAFAQFPIDYIQIYIQIHQK